MTLKFMDLWHLHGLSVTLLAQWIKDGRVMLVFWSNKWAQIEWDMSLTQGICLMLLALWLYAIWPKEELAQIRRDKNLQLRLLLTLDSRI